MALVSTKKSLLLLSASGTPPTAADFIETIEPVLLAPEIGGGEYSRIRGTLNTGNQRYNDLDNVQAPATVTCYMRSNNVAADALGTPPQIANALKVSGFKETINTTTAGQETVVYTNSQAPTNGTAIVYVDGKKYETASNGVASNASFNFTIGEPATVSFDMQMFLDSAIPTDEANPSVTQSSEPLIIVSGINVLTVGGTVLKANNVTINMNNTIETFYTLGGADKLKNKEIVDNGITMDVTYFADSTTFADDYTALQNQTLQAVEIKLGTNASSGLVSGKSLLIQAGKAEVQNVTPSSEQDRVSRTLTYRLQNDSVNNDVALSLKYGYFA